MELTHRERTRWIRTISKANEDIQQQVMQMRRDMSEVSASGGTGPQQGWQ